MPKIMSEHQKIYNKWMSEKYPHELEPCIHCDYYRNLDGGARYKGKGIISYAGIVPNWCCHYSLVTGDIGNPAPCFTDFKCEHFKKRV